VEKDHFVFYHGPFLWRKLETKLLLENVKHIQLQDFVTMTSNGDTLIRHRLVLETLQDEVSFDLLPVDFTQVAALSLWLERSMPQNLALEKRKAA
jgi:hypothetical protein